MGIMDNIGGLADKAKDLAGDHPDQIDQALDKMGDIIDDKTGGRFTDQIDSAKEQVEKQVGDSKA